VFALRRFHQKVKKREWHPEEETSDLSFVEVLEEVKENIALVKVVLKYSLTYYKDLQVSISF